MIKLSTLTPEAVADEVIGWVSSHVMSLCFVAGITDTIGVPGGSLAHEVRELTRYALTGELDGSPTGRIQTVAEALYGAAHPDVYPRVEGDWAEDAKDPERAIDAVIRAALARQTIADGEPVPVRWLCVLAEVPVAYCRVLLSREGLASKGGTVTARRAREWLGARGVAGYR